MTVDFRQGDCRDVLRTLPDKSVHCCITSPPYFGLRDYGMADQIGLEPTPDEFIAELVAVFREVRRVLRDDGTLFLNLGDSYAGGGNGGRDPERWPKQSRNTGSGQTRAKQRTGLKNKDLIGIPWMAAFALRADGWYLRQDIIWHKPNPMPESTIDRCTKAHEYIFMLSKSPTYYFDFEAIAEPATNPEGPGNKKAYVVKGERTGDNANLGGGMHKIGPRTTRRKRSVWTVSPKPFKEAHFATFPPALIEPCVLAGCPLGGTVLDPFGGAGTTGLVAVQNARNAILIELNPEYIKIAARRIYGFKFPWE